MAVILLQAKLLCEEGTNVAKNHGFKMKMSVKVLSTHIAHKEINTQLILTLKSCTQLLGHIKISNCIVQ